MYSIRVKRSASKQLEQLQPKVAEGIVKAGISKMQMLSVAIGLAGLLGCTMAANNPSGNQEQGRDFAVYDLFLRRIETFRIDTFEVNHLSSEGGHLMVFHNVEDTILIFDFWAYSEMGRSNHLFITDYSIERFYFYKESNVDYDKSFYLNDYTEKMNEGAQYLAYTDGRPIALYSAKRELITDSNLILKKLADEKLELFKEIVKEIEIRK